MGENPLNNLNIAYMSDTTTNENGNSTTTTENETEIVIKGDTPTPEEVQALKDQNKKLFERAKKAEGFEKNSEGQWIKKQKPSDTVITKPNTAGIEDEVLDLRLEGYTKPQVEFIMKNGGRKALEDKNSLVSIAIEKQREQARAEHAASQTTDNSSLSEVERKYTPEQMKNMSQADLEKILPHA